MCNLLLGIYDYTRRYEYNQRNLELLKPIFCVPSYLLETRIMERFKLFLKDLWKKEFWKFNFHSKKKTARLVFISLLVKLAIVYCWIDLPTLGWKIGGTAIAIGWLFLNFYQLYTSYHRCKYQQDWDMEKYFRGEI